MTTIDIHLTEAGKAKLAEIVDECRGNYDPGFLGYSTEREQARNVK